MYKSNHYMCWLQVPFTHIVFLQMIRIFWNLQTQSIFRFCATCTNGASINTICILLRQESCFLRSLFFIFALLEAAVVHATHDLSNIDCFLRTLLQLYKHITVLKRELDFIFINPWHSCKSIFQSCLDFSYKKSSKSDPQNCTKGQTICNVQQDVTSIFDLLND